MTIRTVNMMLGRAERDAQDVDVPINSKDVARHEEFIYTIVNRNELRDHNAARSADEVQDIQRIEAPKRKRSTRTTVTDEDYEPGQTRQRTRSSASSTPRRGTQKPKPQEPIPLPQPIDSPERAMGEALLDDAVMNPEVQIALPFDPEIPVGVSPSVQQSFQMINHRLLVLERRAQKFSEPTQWQMQQIEEDLRQTVTGLVVDQVEQLRTILDVSIATLYAEIRSLLHDY